MNQSEFVDWCSALQLLAATIDVIAAIRSAPPSRRVAGRATNVSGSYPSRKMGVTIQFESHTVELWAIYQMEHSVEVLEFYDQPPSFKIQYQAKSGRNIGHYHTPDFFVLRKKGAAWEEWKTEQELQRLEKKYPTRYQRTPDGKWRCPPGEAYAEPLGLQYHVRSSSELHPIFIQNLMFLEDYFGFTAPIPAQFQTHILEKVRAEPGITIGLLLGEVPGVRANDVYIMLAQEQIYADLEAVPLVEHWRVQLYIDQLSYQAHQNLAIGNPQRPRNIALNDLTAIVTNTKLLWDGRFWTLVNFGETTTTLLPEIGQPMQLPTGFFLQLLETGVINISAASTTQTDSAQVRSVMDAASPAHLKEANRRFHLVQAYLEHQPDVYKDIALRTLRRWVKQFREAQAKARSGWFLRVG